jgi:mannosyl-oligosaccharide alpha-1,2-mannosidase
VLAATLTIWRSNGWGASAVDALSTATIMELPKVVNKILTYIPTINYNDTSKGDSAEVSLFETTIRYLGGMLAGE